MLALDMRALLEANVVFQIMQKAPFTICGGLTVKTQKLTQARVFLHRLTWVVATITSHQIIRLTLPID